jgi:hypothetical protein
MNNTSAMNDSFEEPTQKAVIPPSEVQFWTFLVVQVPSLACNIFLLYHLLVQRHLRRALHNHVIIILLCITLGIGIFDNPLYIDAYRLGGNKNSFPMVASICLMWWVFDYGFYGAITVFMAWGSIERHILVFHHHLLRTRRQKLIVHYFPLLIISIYLFGFYIGVIVFPPCQNTFDFEALACGLSPCYNDIAYLSTWDYLFNGIVCASIETICSVALLVRVLWQKRRARQPVNWRKHRKMAFQLLSISCLTLTIVIPQSLIVIVGHLGGEASANFGADVDPYLFFLYTFVVFLMPFICLGSLPELWPKLLFLVCKKRRLVAPLADATILEQSIQVKSRPT